MRIRGRVTAVLTALALPLVPAAVHGAEAAPVPGSEAAPLLGNPASGTTSYVRGTYVWTDYAYDDTGASSSAGSDGSAAYPDGLSNAADLIQLQVRESAAGLRIRAVLETLLDPRVPVLAAGFDTDNDTRTGAASLPGGRWTADGALGLDRLVELSGSRGRLLAWSGGRWRVQASFPVAVDTATNTLTATVSGLRPGRATWRAVAAVGVNDSAGHNFLDGGEPIFDLAFVGGELPTGWQDSRQGDILAGRLPSAHAVAAVHFSRVADGVTALAPDSGPGWHTRLYRSALRLGEGIRQATITGPEGVPVPVGNLYAGPYQPYLVWVPSTRLGAHPPLIVYMHGFSQTHTGNATSFGPPRSGFDPTSLVLGNGGFVPPAIVVFPLGRGQNTFYIGAAEQDVLDVTDDAVGHYNVDSDRVVLSGDSMGGFGTFKLAVRYPDRWSALVPFIGTGGSAQYEFSAVPAPMLNQLFSPATFPSGNAELLQNLADLPMFMVNGQVDPIVNNLLVTQDAVRLDQLGYDYRSWVLLRRNHEVVPALSNCVLLQALEYRRDADPAHVVFSSEPATYMSDRASGLSLRYDHAYWVSDVVVRAGAALGTVDATSLARPDRSSRATRILAAGQNLTEGADLCGPNRAVQTGDAWREQGIALSAGGPQPVSNGARISLTSVESARLNLTGMRLNPSKPMTFTVTSDGPARLVLAAGKRTVVLAVQGGTHVYRLS